MSSMTLFILFVSIIAILFLVLNLLFAPHNPYAEKFSSFECGFHSFLGQNRSQFNVKFFIFGLVFLLFDLEITLVFPFAVSQSNNDIYGLIIVLIFLIIVTIGFVYELGKGALKIDSKQNIGLLKDNQSKASISFLGKLSSINKDSSTYRYSGGDGIINIRRLHTYPKAGHERASFNRLYSTNIKASQGSLEFWKQVRSSKLDENNVFFLVNRFLKDFPTPDLASMNLTCSFINSILSGPFKGFELSSSDFELLKKIEAIKLELPVDPKRLAEAVGKYVRGNEVGKAGVYKFTNQINGFCYIGSSISLANRLSTGYLGPKLGNRVIDRAIKDTGLDKFYLELYLIPQEIEERILRDFITEVDRKQQFKNFSLALEQIHLLTFNPEFNVLKVAGSPVGLKRTPESMEANFLKTSKVTYVYDEKTKKLLFSSSSITKLANLLNIELGNLSKLISGDSLYLNRILFSNQLLCESDYIAEVVSSDELISFIDELRQERKNLLRENMVKVGLAGSNKRSKKVELTNTETEEILVFDSLNQTARYLQSLGGKFSKSGPGALTSNINKGNLYKDVFKIKYI